MKNINSVLKNKYLIISVIGHHAGESLADIFTRKKEEISDAGKSFWLIKSFKAKTDYIQNIGKIAHDNDEEVYCVFIDPSSQGGAQPTKTNDLATKFSKDNRSWLDIPMGIKVTGKVDKNSTALVLGDLSIVSDKIDFDLWEYSNFLDNSEPIKMSQGASTVCGIKKFNQGMKSRHRKIVAFGKLVEPYAVWLK